MNWPGEEKETKRDKMIDWVLVIDASSLEQAKMGKELLLKAPLNEWGGERREEPFIYRLMHYLAAPDGR